MILAKNKQAGFRIADGLTILHYGYLDKQIREKDKKNRNLKLICEELASSPENQLLRYHYGVELFRAGRYAEAVSELSQAAGGLDPNTLYLPKLIRYIIMSYQALGQSEQAIRAVLYGLKFFPDYADLYYYAGLAYREIKQYSLAQEAFHQAIFLPEPPTHYAGFGGIRGFRAYHQLGLISEEFLDYESALGFYVSALRDNPDFIPALERIVHILEPQKNPANAKQCLEKICDFGNPRASQMIGEIYFREGAFGLALDYWEKTGLSALSPDLLLWRGICLIQKKRFREALKILESFSPANPLYPLAKINQLLVAWLENKKTRLRTLLAELHFLGLAKDTEKVLDLLNFLPGDPPPDLIGVGADGMALLLDIVTRLLSLDEDKKAKQLLHLVHPASLKEYRLDLARIYFDHGLFGKAEILLRQYLSEKQGEHKEQKKECKLEAHLLLADLHEQNGNAVEAEQYYRIALELDPGRPKSYVRLLQLYAKRERQLNAAAQPLAPASENVFLIQSEGGRDG